MTKQHFIRAAELVRAINAGDWTSDAPDWADSARVRAVVLGHQISGDGDYTRAVQTAEAFIMLFTEHNPRFDRQRFLVACGLAEAPAKKGKC